MKNLVFTEQSIITFAENITQEKIEKKDFSDPKNYIQIKYEYFLFFLTGNNKDSCLENIPFIIFNKDVDFDNISVEDIRNMLFEVHRIVNQVLQHKGTMFSSPSIIYRKDNLLVLNIVNDRHLFLSINANRTKNFMVFKITDSKEDKIENTDVDYTICNECDLLRSELKKKYKAELEKVELSQIDYFYNLNTVFNNEEQSAYTFEKWKSILSPRQKAFFDNNNKKALKLIGPAGTGKTLVMELKAIQLMKNNKNCKILYTCHSWSVACQVSDFIDMVAPEISNSIIICPLLELAKESVAIKNKNIIFLGDDNNQGKYEQIMIISEIVQDFLKTDWVVYKDQCTQSFINDIESISDVNNNFTWQIMVEIACVIGANGIMPGKNSFVKYNQISRRNWMMSLSSEVEKNVIFSIYTKYMDYLLKNNSISSDQIINDYINFLTTYNWYYEREKSGYDYIFVDEMQLFNDQEKLALTYLSRNTDEYPVIIMALDPKQAVDEIYSDLGIDEICNTTNPSTAASMGKTELYTLDIAYRYTKEILNFLKHIDSSYPQMDLGHDWNNGIRGIKAYKLKSGIYPMLYTFNDKDDEIKNALRIAKEYSKNGKQTAVLSLQDNLFSILQEQTSDSNTFKKILSKKDIALLKYTKKKILISKPNYVIGLQFDAVILIGCYSIFNKHDSNQSYYQRIFLSDLYLGASRSKQDLILTNNKEMVEFPDFLQKAIDIGYLKVST